LPVKAKEDLITWGETTGYVEVVLSGIDHKEYKIRREFAAIIRTKLEIGIRNKIVVGTQKFEVIGDPQKTRNAVLCTLVEVK
jgi:DNA repair exonuclease SbcCD ATPase subunit